MTFYDDDDDDDKVGDKRLTKILICECENCKERNLIKNVWGIGMFSDHFSFNNGKLLQARCTTILCVCTMYVIVDDWQCIELIDVILSHWKFE